RVVNYPEGLTIKVKLLQGATEKNRSIYIPKKIMQNYMGKEESAITIIVKDRTIYKGYNPNLSEATQGYRYEVPSWVGSVGEEVEINIRKLDTFSFLKTVGEASLPFRIIVKPDGKIFLLVGRKEIPVHSVTEVKWEGGNLRKAYVFLTILDYANVEHVIKIAYDGHEESFVGIMLGGHPRRIYSVQYIKGVDVLEVVYGYKEGSTNYTHTIRLTKISSITVLNGNLFDEEILGEGFLPPDLVDQTNWDSETEKGKLGLLIAMAIYGKEGCEDVKIDNSGRNDWSEKDETRYYIFDVCGTVNGEFIGSEVKLSTVSKEEMFEKLNDKYTQDQLIKNMKSWNSIAPKHNEPLVSRGTIIAIYVNKDTGHFWFAVKWVDAP
ncbi:MAG: hypothetical protein QXO75_11205, partial [Nitrososphaerota archaeon]